MDYEKAYKEALEKARGFMDFYKDNPAQAQKFIDIFPELAESEDERFRRYIIEVCESSLERDQGAHFCKLSTKQLKEFLEKQQEQKPELEIGRRCDTCTYWLRNSFNRGICNYGDPRRTQGGDTCENWHILSRLFKG